MNRRDFLQATAVTGATLALPAVEGCSGSEVENAINTVIKEVVAVLAVAAPGASWLTELQQALAALETAEQQWTNGGAVQLVDDALNTIVAITAVIPLTAVYSPLIDVLVSGIEICLGLLPVSASVSVKATPQGNPHVGRYQMPTYVMHPTPAARFKAAWNSVAKANKLDYAILR